MTDFAKYQALGNDYLVVDPRRVPLDPTPEHVRLLCDRRLGVGADGLALAPVGAGRPVRVQLWNPDGTECGRSANGLRIVALHLHAQGAAGTDTVLRTTAGDSDVRILDPAAGTVRIGIGRPSFAAADVPVLGEDGPVLSRPLRVGDRTLTMSCLDNGNPHAVILLPSVGRELAEELGPLVAGHPRFPRRVNVQFARVVDRATLEIEVWERAAGYTLASGSSACAAAAVAHRLGLVDPVVEVRMPGGSVEVVVAPDGQVALTGPVEQVAVGTFSPALRRRLGLPVPAAGVPAPTGARR